MTTDPSHARHPFLDDLSPDVVLTASVLRRPVTGKENVLHVVKAAASLYEAQRPLFHEKVGLRSFLAYDSDLVGGRTVRGLVLVERNPDGAVVALNINFSPIDGCLSMAVRLGEIVGQDLGDDLFL